MVFVHPPVRFLLEIASPELDTVTAGAAGKTSQQVLVAFFVPAGVEAVLPQLLLSRMLQFLIHNSWDGDGDPLFWRAGSPASNAYPAGSARIRLWPAACAAGVFLMSSTPTK